MTLYEQIQAAQATVDADKAKLAQDQAALNALAAQQVTDGIDVSAAQGTVDWAKVKTAAGFVIHKVADGDLQDPTYTAAEVQAIRAAGLRWGPYYFARVASDGNLQRSGKVEAGMAIWFAQRQGWKVGDLPLAYDFETLNGQTAAKAAQHLVDFVRAYQYLLGHLPILYVNPGTWQQVEAPLQALPGALELLGQCPLWIAHFGVAAPSVPATWQQWAFWQYSDKGTCAGLTGAVDRSHFAGSAADLAALRYG